MHESTVWIGDKILDLRDGRSHPAGGRISYVLLDSLVGGVAVVTRHPHRDCGAAERR